MRGYITCEHCKGVGKTFKCKWLLIFGKICPCCNGTGYIWVNNIDEYFNQK